MGGSAPNFQLNELTLFYPNLPEIVKKKRSYGISELCPTLRSYRPYALLRWMCYRHVGPTDLKSCPLQNQFRRREGHNPENPLILKILIQTIEMARDRPSPYGKGTRFESLARARLSPNGCSHIKVLQTFCVAGSDVL